MDLKSLFNIFVTSEIDYKSFDPLPESEELSGAVQLDKLECAILPLAINPGVINIIHDAIEELDNLDKMKARFGSSLGLRIYNAYKSQNVEAKQCPIIGIPLMGSTCAGLFRNGGHLLGYKGESYKDTYPVTIKRFLSNDHDLKTNRVSCFQAFAWMCFTNVFAERFQYETKNYEATYAAFSNPNTYARNSIFWDLKDDGAHSMMSMIHVINKSVSQALYYAVMASAVADANADLNDCVEESKVFDGQAILRELAALVEKTVMTPSLYALIAYIWLSTPADTEAGAVVSALLWNDDVEFISHYLHTFTHPTATSTSTKKIKEIETGYTCVVNNGYTSYITVLMGVADSESFLKSDLSQYGLLKFKTSTDSICLFMFENVDVKTGKTMTMIDMSKTTFQTVVNVTGIDTYVLQNSKNYCIDWIRCVSILNYGNLTFTADDYNWISKMSADVVPWAHGDLSDCNVHGDAYFALLKRMVGFSASTESVREILLASKDLVCKLTPVARGVLTFIISRKA
nr:non-structural protein [Homalodisca vitripennis reovirus]